VVGGRILTGCYYTIECAGLRLKKLGAFAKKRVLLTNCPNSGENVTRHYSFIFYAISLILSEYDRILAGCYYTIDNRGLNLKKSGGICRNTIFFKKNKNITILNPAPLGEFASDFLDLE
jgi:hypothetical protein